MLIMAAVAQLVEPRVVISVVVGSSPISRPIFYSLLVVSHYYYFFLTGFST